MSRINRVFFLIIIPVLFLAGCQEEVKTDSLARRQEKLLYAQRAQKKIDSCSAFLKDGSIILRRGNDVISEMFALLNKTDPTFSHCGIVFREEGNWVVYHSIGGEDNPDEKMRRDTYDHFVNPEHNTGLGLCTLNLDEGQVKKLRHVIDSLYTKKVPFDMKFDLESDDRLYCAEMLFKSYRLATGNDSLFPTTLHQGFRYVSTDNIFANKHSVLLCRIIY